MVQRIADGGLDQADVGFRSRSGCREAEGIEPSPGDPVRRRVGELDFAAVASTGAFELVEGRRRRMYRPPPRACLEPLPGASGFSTIPRMRPLAVFEVGTVAMP